VIRWLAAGLSAMLAVGAPLAAQGGIQPQVWTEVDLQHAFGSVVAVTVPLVVRFDTKTPNPFLVAAGAMGDFAVVRWATLTAGYLYVSLPHVPGATDLNVPLAALTLHAGIGPIEIAHRSRVEWLDGLPGAPVRYRDRLQVAVRADQTGRWYGVASAEAFDDVTHAEWTKVRIQAGVTRRIGRFGVYLYYLEESPLAAGQLHVRGAGTTVAVGL